MHWYNHEHRHSGIRYVTPAQRHAGQDRPLLEARHAVYQAARDRNPRRWSRQTRNWTPVTAVTLNPERDSIVRSATSEIQPSRSIGTPAFPPGPGAASPPHTADGLGLRRAGQGSRATRSHAQRSEHGEHRTFLAVSTAASLTSVGGLLDVQNRRSNKLSRYQLRAATCLTLTGLLPSGPARRRCRRAIRREDAE